MKLNVQATRRAAALMAIVLSPALTAAAAEPDALARPALKADRLQGRVFLGLAQAGSRLVAVGERGLIALSDDNGKSWRQAASPVSVTLTSVSFADAQAGWAVGHAGTILHTGDGGANWVVQLDGRRVAQLVQASGLDAVAAQLAADGPDKPFLDTQFTDARHGLAVGAYGLAVRTSDGGRSWESFMHQIPNPKGLHLYAARQSGGAVWLAGEQGYFARAGGSGEDFARIETPYRGSYFALAATGSGVLLAGLKGNAFRVSQDGGAFQRIEGLPPVSLSGAAVLRDGSLAFANQSGQVLLCLQDCARMSVLSLPPRGPLTALAQAADGALVLAGPAGLSSAAMPSVKERPQ
jgi:photosystem II stability/assembly factor-like uncharacterized protein